MAGMNETKVSGELFEFGEDRQFNAKIVGTRVDNPNIVESNENSRFLQNDKMSVSKIKLKLSLS